VALVAAFAIALIATPAGISAAVLLLPFQVSVLGTPSPAVTPTNLLYNVVATPGALYQYWRQGQTGGALPLAIPSPVLIMVAALVGCVGGIYGIGGGSILSPLLIGSGRPAAEVAPAALASTFVTSVAGVATFTILSLHLHGPVAPAWSTGVALGIGGLAGGYTGARIQSRLPDALIRRIVGFLVIASGARYLWSGLS
jgi:uncharacterized protein